MRVKVKDKHVYCLALLSLLSFALTSLYAKRTLFALASVVTVILLSRK